MLQKPITTSKSSQPRLAAEPAATLNRRLRTNGELPDACRDDRSGLCGPGLRRLLCRFRPRRLLRRQGPGQDRGPQPRRDPDLRAGPGRARRQERARGPPDLHHRPAAGGPRAPRPCSSRSARRRGAATAMPTCPTSIRRPREIAAAIDGYTVVVTKSTVPVGTGDEVERIIREARPDADFAVVSNPEFLREGAAIADFKRPDRIVIGTEDERAASVMTRALPPALPQPVAAAGHVAAHGGADQIRRQRLPRHQDHLHQRDRRPVRAGRRRRAGRGARHRPRQPHRRQVPACRARAMAARAFPRTRWR